MRASQIAAAALLGLMLPAHAKDVHCTAANSHVAALQAKLPIEVDAVTRTTAAAANCDDKKINLTRRVALKQSRMESDFKDFLQRQDNEYVCTDKSRRALVDAGWTWSVSYTFQDGAPVTITAACG